MATIDDYRTGKIVEGIKKAELAFDSRSAFEAGNPVFGHIREKIVAFRPVWITAKQAAGLIWLINRQSRRRFIASMVSGKYL